MKIAFVEIQNFRKLQSCRIEFGPESTVFVGANNSGKTSAMTALKKFLKKRQLVLNDFTMTNFIGINNIGHRIIEPQEDNPILQEEWRPLLPAMDVWLDVRSDELRYVAEIIPTLDWTEGKIGIRLIYEPKDYEKLYGDFAESFKKAHEGKDGLKLWPNDFCDFLGTKMQALFTMNAYILNPENIQDVDIGDIARPQTIPTGAAPLEFDPFKNLVRVDIISAQRGLDDSDDADESPMESSLLSDQLRSYYDRQLDPEHEPSASDLKALKELQGASEVFNQQISKKFHKAMKELSQFGYPGRYNPSIIVEAKTKAGDILSHNTTVRYPLFSDTEIPYTLPEKYNGLGYQNLISMSFKLMCFRDSWVNGNRRNQDDGDQETKVIPPIHLVLIEEPEAHLHTQVQQVFIKNAYKILRNHSKLRSKKVYTTQLLVTTHSSYIALESKFENLRYFRRTKNSSKLPTTVVINLNTVFGSKTDTAKFVTRYLKTTHCDLFFADAVIMVEGAAERMLLPHFIEHCFEQLNQTYISILEINGRHAHRLRELIETLGIFCLIITDIDTVDPQNKKSVMPQRNKGQISTNETIINWVPMQSSADKLWEASPEEKQVQYANNPDAFIRVAYQIPVKIKFSDGTEHELIPTTFEDALAYENYYMFKTLKGLGAIKKLRAIFKDEDPAKISKGVYDLIYGVKDKDGRRKKGIDKAEFALQLLYNKDPQKIAPPSYIAEALQWLEDSLIQREDEDFASEGEV